MTSVLMKHFAAGALLLAASGYLVAVQAQVFRIVGPDGRVTYSDKPPPAASNTRVTSGTGSAGGGSALASLPFELRQVAAKYPVTLYTGENCPPCGAARSLLITRGVPFAEKTVNTAEDAQALQRISGESSLPFATVGSQQLKGFSDAEWTQFLNAAGYPTASVLPSSYRTPAATPLVTVAAATPAAAPGARSAPAAPAATPAPAPPAASNPAGIKF